MKEYRNTQKLDQYLHITNIPGHHFGSREHFLNSLFYCPEFKIRKRELEVPLESETRAAIESAATCKIVTQLNLSADIEIVNSEIFAHIVPDLRFGQEHEFSSFLIGILIILGIPVPKVGVLSPNIGKSAE